MWSEQWDDKIREAAGQAEPSSGMEQGWQSMEPLLEQHLPQDRKKRRFFLLLFLLAASGGSVFLALQPGGMAKKTPPERTVSLPVPAPYQPGDQPAGGDRPVQEYILSDSLVGPDHGVVSTDIPPTKTTERPPAQPASGRQKSPFSSATTATDRSGKADPRTSALNTTTENSVLPYIPNLTDSRHAAIDSTERAEGLAQSKSAQPATDSTEEAAATVQQVDKSTREKNPRWAISAVVGADISGTQPGKPGQWRPAVGILINYQLNRRWQLRTGFLTTRKVYQAGEGDYHPPKIFWNYVSKLEHVDANCLIYEIPLLLQYRLGKQANSRWAVSAGLSSLLMKRESYDYDFIDLAGQDRYMNREYKNYSNHLFSTLHLSGSYQLSLSKRWKLAAEPYLKLPISGVGYGKVKLYSAGIMLSATIHP